MFRLSHLNIIFHQKEYVRQNNKMEQTLDKRNHVGGVKLQLFDSQIPFYSHSNSLRLNSSFTKLFLKS